jgi:peptidoglycan/xylan/chitin deacetylase (PgdA/CDA1 family)
MYRFQADHMNERTNTAMKRIGPCRLFLASLIPVLILNAQSVTSSYEVGTWLGFRVAAVSFTFDDGCAHQFDIAVPMFNEFDYKMTLFTATNTDWIGLPDWDALQNAANQGHEIASHTITHTNMGGMSDSLQHVELKDSRDEIDSHVSGQRCLTLAYPYCVASKKSITEQYYIAGRICSGSIVQRNPADFMNISSIICGTEGSVNATKDYVNRGESAVRSKGWCVYLIHGIDDDGGWSPIASDTLRKALEYYYTNQNLYWVETFGNVVRYIKERTDITLTELSDLDSAITLQITDTLDDSIYNYPLSLRRPLPQGWISATVTQDGQPMEAWVMAEDNVQYIVFDAVPDQGDIVISKSDVMGIQDNGRFLINSPALVQNFPNPFNPATTIRYVLPRAGHVVLKIIDVQGRKVSTLLNQYSPAGMHSLEFNAQEMSSGVYFYTLQVGNVLQQRKMMILR